MPDSLPSSSERRRSRRTARREARRSRYEALFEPRFTAFAGLAISLAFLFQPSLILRAVLFAAFFLAAIASGKRVSPIATLAVSIGIVAANLLVPVGKVLVHIGPLIVTEFALLDGIGKASHLRGAHPYFQGQHSARDQTPRTLRIDCRSGLHLL